MSHLLTTMFFNDGAFSGTDQLSLGPGDIGLVHKLFRCHVRGQVNVQSETGAVGTVNANFWVWGVNIVPHGDSPDDVIESADSDAWLIRGQIGYNDYVTTWAPSSDDCGVLGGFGLTDEWAGQLNLAGAEMDLYFCIKTATTALPNANVFTTVRLWWY
jgi:hypothetical protein